MANAGKIAIVPKGEYNSATAYETLNLVSHKGKSWVAKQNVYGIEPSTANKAYWHEMAGHTALNNLDCTEAGYVLDARQGKVLMDAINATNADLEAKNSERKAEIEEAMEQIAEIANNQIPDEYLQSAVDEYVAEYSGGFATQANIAELKSDLIQFSTNDIINLNEVTDKNFNVVEIIRENDFAEFEDGTEKTTSASSVFGCLEIIPKGLNHISINTEESITLYLFEIPTVGNDALTLVKKADFTPTNNVVSVYVNTDKPTLFAFKGVVKYKSGGTFAKRKRLLSITETDTSYTYSIGMYLCFDLSIKNLENKGITRKVLDIPVAHFRASATGVGVLYEELPNVLTSNIMDVSEISNIIITATDKTANIHCNVFKYDNDNNYVGYDVVDGIGKVNYKINSKNNVRLALSFKGLTDSDTVNDSDFSSILLVNVENDILYNVVNGAGTRIKLIGDSITQGSGSTGYVEWNDGTNTFRGNAPNYPDADENYVVGDYLGTKGKVVWYEAISGTGWAHLMKSYLESRYDCVVKNYGMGGATTADILNNLDNIVTSDDDVVVLMIGTNDKQKITLNEYRYNLDAIVSKLVNDGKQVVVMSPIPLSGTLDEESGNFYMSDANDSSCSIAKEYDLQYIGLFNKIQEYCEYTETDYDALLKADNTHPRDSGYAVMYKLIMRELGFGITQ